MGLLDEIEKRHRRWVMAGRPGAYDESELLERMERAEYALRSFAQWYAAQGTLGAAPMPHEDALAIAGGVFELRPPQPRPFIACGDRELLLAEVRELWTEVKELREELGRSAMTAPEINDFLDSVAIPPGLPWPKEAHEGPCSTACAHPPERFGLGALPPRLIVVSDDTDQPGMHGEGTYP